MHSTLSDTGPAGNVYDKYNARNPIARKLMQGFLTSWDRLFDMAAPQDVHEIGCGEGELTRRAAARAARVRGTDVGADAVAEARRRAAHAALPITPQFRTASLYDLDPEIDGAEMIVCCEVLEHVADPEAALEILARLSRRWLLTSVPREPIWRVLNMARGKYLSDLGNTPGHLHHWSSNGFRTFIASRFDIVEIATPLPWTMILARPRD